MNCYDSFLRIFTVPTYDGKGEKRLQQTHLFQCPKNFGFPIRSSFSNSATSSDVQYIATGSAEGGVLVFPLAEADTTSFSSSSPPPSPTLQSSSAAVGLSSPTVLETDGHKTYTVCFSPPPLSLRNASDPCLLATGSTDGVVRIFERNSHLP